MRILVTGAAGFIGFHVARRLLADRHEVVGLDSVNQYYDVRLKEGRLGLLQQHRHFEFVRAALADPEAMNQLFDRCDFDRVIHLAAQAGVRYSLERPDAYIASNVLGFLQVLEEPVRRCRSQSGGVPIIRCPCTAPRSGLMSSWRTATRICSACRRRACGSLRYTVLGAVRTW